MRRVKIDWILRAGIGVMLVALVYVLSAAIYQRVVVAGDRAPKFTITTDNGRSVSIPDFGGKVLVLNFWASWCQPCVEEEPSLNAFAQQFANKGVVVLGVSVDESCARYEDFLRKHPVTFQTTCEEPATKRLAEAYGSVMIPETYVIDREGKIARKIIGPQQWDSGEMLNYFDGVLERN